MSCMTYDDRVTRPRNATSGCPLGVRRESCGAGREDLRVKTITTGPGELCLTLSPGCASSAVDPPIAIGTATRLVDQHRRPA